MIKLNLKTATIGGAIFAIILALIITFLILLGATWLVCYLWAIPFTWRIFGGAAIIYMLFAPRSGK